MTYEQSRILDFLVEQNEASIVGGAGTGKTILAVEKAKRLSEDGPVLFLCFNRFLADDLKVRFMNNPNIEVHNPQTLYYQFNKTQKIDIGELSNDLLNEFLIEMEESSWKYKHIVIDEGQDIDSMFILLLKYLCNKDETGFFYVFYDQNQTVQNSKDFSWKKEIPCQLVLNTNCRNTINIAKTSHSILNLNNIKIKSDIIGSKTQLHIVESIEDLTDSLGKKIKTYLEKGYRLSDITIITLTSINKSILNGISRVGSYKLSVDEKESRSILFTTARKFKGLESNIVLIVDFDKNTFDNDVNSMLFYVATSRAKVNLSLFFMGSDETFSELLDAANPESLKYPKLVLRKKLNVDIS